MSILEQKWKTLHKKDIGDVRDEVVSLVEKSPREIHIGTDAQKHGKNTDFVTVVVVLDPGHGGVVFYTKSRVAYVTSLQHKLFTEVGFSIEIALALCELVDAEQIQVHVDANTNMKWESGPFHQRLAGMVVAHGFKAILKPDAWAASHVADHAVKNKNFTGRKPSRRARRREAVN
jgi:predicted RNase H-related nuclease YkuK (DUF458 family)